MRVLQLCNKPPLPAVDGGCLAMHAVTEGLLQAGIAVHVLAIETSKHPLIADRIPEKYYTDTAFQTVKVDTSLSISKLLGGLFSGKSVHVSRFHSEAFEKKLAGILQQEKFDIIQLESLFMSPYIPLIRKYSDAKIILRAHNVESNLWRRRVKQEQNSLRRFIASRLLRSLVKKETSVLNEVDAILPITGDDSTAIKTFLRRPVPVHVLHFAMTLQPLTTGIPQPNTVFHIGAMDWAPNQEGVQWFIRNCWPLVLAEVPVASLHLAGKGLGKNDPAYRGKNIFLHGEVPEAFVFMQHYSVMVLPLLSGGGMRIKLVEAMALGKPVVTTTIGAEGTGFVHEQTGLAGDTPAEMAKGIIRFLKNADLSRECGMNARRHAEKNFDRVNATKELITFYQSLLS
jgi:polysaccharide biosynthesis protein PslH